MTEQTEIFLAIVLTEAVRVGAAGLIGYGIYRLVSPRTVASTPTELGRKWFAFIAFYVCLTSLPRFFRQTDVDSFANWLAMMVGFGGPAFALGWTYGRFFKFKSAFTGSPNYSAANQATHSSSTGSIERRLAELDELFKKGLINSDEYQAKRQDILNQL